MSQNYDPYHLKSPTIYLVKNVVFLVIVALVAAILSTRIRRQLSTTIPIKNRLAIGLAPPPAGTVQLAIWTKHSPEW